MDGDQLLVDNYFPNFKWQKLLCGERGDFRSAATDDPRGLGSISKAWMDSKKWWTLTDSMSRHLVEDRDQVKFFMCSVVLSTVVNWSMQYF